MRKLLLALFVLLSMTSPTQANENFPATGGEPIKQTLVVGMIDFPPLSYHDETGQATGLLVTLMHRVVEHAGYHPEFRILPLARLIQSMQEGSIRVWPGIPGKLELASHTLVGGETLGHLNVNLYYRPETMTPRWPDDVRGRDVILLTGYDYGPNLSHHIDAPANRLRIHRTHSHSAAIGMLLHRRADYLLNYQAPMDEALLERPDVQLQHLTLARTPLMMVVSDVGKPAAADVLKDLEQAYRELRERGEIEPLPNF